MSRHECPECGHEIVTDEAPSRAGPPTLFCVHEDNAIEMEATDAGFNVSDYLNG